jgi:thymidylate synthase (FAD)
MALQSAPFGISKTKRFVSEGGEKELYLQHGVGKHDSGYVALVDYMGGDGTIEYAATSTRGKGIFHPQPTQQDFFAFLAGNGITRPFKWSQLKFEVQVPISVALRVVYNPAVNVNEYSGRYSVLLKSAAAPPEEKLDPSRFKHIQELRERNQGRYEALLNENVARELARSVIGSANDTRFYLKIPLDELARMVRERPGDTALTRACLDSMADIASEVAPEAWKALMLGRRRATYPALNFPRDKEIIDPDLSGAPWQEQETRRITVPDLENRLFVAKRVLNHGEFQVTDYMGDDSSPAQAARTSYGEGTKTLTDDKKLIDTLVREKHTSPIEMCELAIVEKTPVMIDPRQLGRHRTLDFTGFLNIHPIGPQFYQPFVEELKKQDRVNRQGRGEPIEQKRVEVVQTLFREAVDDTNRTLEELAVAGVSEELLREQRGVGFYTIVSRTGDPLNWARFLQLRNDPHAQKESQCYAQQVAEALKAHIPATYKAFEDHWFKAVTFGETEQRLIKEKGLLRREDLPAPEELAGTPLAIPIDRNDNSKGHKWSRQGLDFINRLGQLKG